MKIFILFTFILLNFSVFAVEKLDAIGHFQRVNRGDQYNDCWGYTDKNGREYALLGVRSGLSIIDITDSEKGVKMKEISFIASTNSIWKDIKTFKNYAYVVNESGGGIQIIDLSNLPESATLVNTFMGQKNSHNLYIDEQRELLFAENNHSEPITIYSLKDPVNLKKLSSFGVEVHDMYARDGFVYVSEGGHGTIGIFDYNDPRNPKLAGRFQIPRAGYVHNAWLADDGKHLMTTEENTGKTIKMWDISDLKNVKMVSEYLAPGKLAHNTHIKGNYAYISHYGSGLRIVDISKPEQMTESAFFMEGASARNNFVDVWGAYPFFKSGKILISDIENGLYIVNFAGAKEN